MPAAFVEIVAAHDTMHAAARKLANTTASAIAAAPRPSQPARGRPRARRRRDEQPALHHVDRDVALYGRGRVTACLPLRAMRAR